MAFRDLVNRGVDQAFGLVGDLAKNVTFTNSGTSAYNFTTQTATTNTPVSTVIKGIIDKQTRVKVGNSNRYVTELKILFKYSDVGVLDMNDTISLNGRTWRLENYDTDEYLVTGYFRAEE